MKLTWQSVLRAVIISEWLPTLLRSHFPRGTIPADVIEAILPEVDNMLAGEPVNLFELRRLVQSLVDDAARAYKERAE